MADGNFDRLTVLTSIGVGIETPNAQLHIDANTTEGKVLVESGSNLFKLSVDSVGAEIGTVNAIPFTLKTDGSSRLTISTLGNIGIDKPNPEFRFDVNGTVNATGYNKDGVPWKLQTGDLEDNAVTSAKIADLSVTTNELSNGAVTFEKLAGGAVTEFNLASNAVTTTKIANNAVTSTKIADQSINAAKVLAGSIGAAQLGTNAVTTDKILNACITAAKIASGVIPPDIGISVSSALSDGQTIPPPRGFAVSECIFFAFAKAFTVSGAGGSVSVFANSSGRVSASASTGGSVSAVGVAIAKRGGWS